MREKNPFSQSLNQLPKIDFEDQLVCLRLSHLASSPQLSMPVPPVGPEAILPAPCKSPLTKSILHGTGCLSVYQGV